MKKLSILAFVLLGSTAALAQTTPAEDIKVYINSQITDAVTQLTRTDGDLQTQIKTLEQQVATLSSMVEATNLYDTAFYFDFGSNKLSVEEAAKLTTVVEFLKKNPSAYAVIEGHADERGSREYNIVLGKQRAESVRQIMVDSGIAVDRLDIISYGEERPVCIYSTDDCLYLNRRSQINIKF
jgi:peptidoglycan-associated lipoprotein